MKKNKNKTLFFIFLFSALIIVIALFLGSNEQNPINKNVSESVDESADLKNMKFVGDIFYLLKTTNGNEIYKISNDNNPKLIFSDADEDFKIKSAFSITSDGKILAQVGSESQEFGGSLILIDTSNPGKYSKIKEEFASTQPPIISPNSKKIAYIIFSNIETDYGFSLYLMDTNGENIQKISSDPVNIKILSWNSSGSKIAYLKGNINEGSEIYVSDLSGKEEKIISFKEKVYSLCWKNDLMLFSKGPLSGSENAKTEIYSMNDNGKNVKRISTNNEMENYVTISPDANYISFLSVKYDNNVDINKSGQIVVEYLSSQENNIKLSEANYIIGWIK